MEVTKSTSKDGRKLLWLLAPLGLFALFAAWQSWPNNRNVPAELIGEWRTSDPRYDGRSFEISPIDVSFGAGNGTVTTGFIKEVQVSHEDGKTLYTVTYDYEGMKNQLSLYYEPPPPGTISFKNQPGIFWTRGPWN